MPDVVMGQWLKMRGQVHADAEAEQWCVLMEPTINDKGPETLEALLRNGPLEKGKVRALIVVESPCITPCRPLTLYYLAPTC